MSYVVDLTTKSPNAYHRLLLYVTKPRLVDSLIRCKFKEDKKNQPKNATYPNTHTLHAKKNGRRVLLGDAVCCYNWAYSFNGPVPSASYRSKVCMTETLKRKMNMGVRWMTLKSGCPSLAEPAVNIQWSEKRLSVSVHDAKGLNSNSVASKNNAKLPHTVWCVMSEFQLLDIRASSFEGHQRSAQRRGNISVYSTLMYIFSRSYTY